MGSLINGAPGGITAEVFPPKVSGLTEAGSTALPPADNATVAEPIVTGRAPYSLEKTTRTWSPPTLMRAIWRTVWSPSTSGTLNGAGSSSAQRGAGVAAQVVIHGSVPALSAGVAAPRVNAPIASSVATDPNADARIVGQSRDDPDVQ